MWVQREDGQANSDLKQLEAICAGLTSTHACLSKHTGAA